MTTRHRKRNLRKGNGRFPPEASRAPPLPSEWATGFPEILEYPSFMRPAFIGIDVAMAKGKHLPIAVSVLEDNRLIPQRLRELSEVPPRGSGNVAVLDPVWRQTFASEARYYILQVCNRLGLVPARIAIDAPSAPCATSTKRRVAEVALDKAGISCFATPSAVDFELIHEKVNRHLTAGGAEDRIPHSNQLWMLAGFAIFKELAEMAECIEVFPQATVRVAGSGQAHKSEPGAVDEQLQAASRHTGWPAGRSGDPVLAQIAWGTPHDRLDAYLSSWVASLNENDRVAFGQPPDDAIWVPRLHDAYLERVPTRESRPAPTSRRSDYAGEGGSLRTATLVCPACGKHPFKRWPWGWDAHAAHTCSGLTMTEPEARKIEFRQRFADYF